MGGADLIIIAAVAVAFVFVVVRYVQNLRNGGCNCGCGGSGHAKTRAVKVADTDESHYPYATDLAIGGMSCDGCAKNVANALNALDGTWARVDLGTRTAHVLTKRPADPAALEAAVRNAGYFVVHA